MSILSRLNDVVTKAAKKALPVINERVLEDPALERTLAKRGIVPKRCGLCRSFRTQDMKDTAQMNPAFGQAMGLLPPSIMGVIKGTSKSVVVGSAEARALRPDLSDRWEDYGGCTKYTGTGVWGFAEKPLVGEPALPCEAWR